MKILIISFYFPPYNSIASIRVGKMAKYLTKFGHEVKVISASKDPLPRDLDLEIPAENVRHTKWIKLSPENLQTNIRGAVARSNGLYNFTRGCWRTFKSIVYFPDVFIGWIPYAVKAANELLRTWKPDIIFVSAAPCSSFLAASHISRRFKIPWIADLRDPWTDNHCYPFGKIRKSIERKLENKVLSSATGITTVSQPWAERLRSRFNNPVEMVCNGFDPSDYDLLTAPVKASPEVKLNIVYVGTIYDDFQDPSPLFLALKKFDKKEIRVSFYGTLSPRLRYLIKSMEVEDKVEIKEPVPYLQSLNAQKNADVLLLLSWMDVEEKGVYPAKLFEYLGAGRPILGVGPDLDVAADLIKQRNLGIVSSSCEEIGIQLKKWLDEKEQQGALASLPIQSCNGFSREEQARRLEQFMVEIIKEGQV